jgi:hypothetical protein
VQEVFNVDGDKTVVGGVVVPRGDDGGGGMCAGGTPRFAVGDAVWLGPASPRQRWLPAVVRSIHRHRVPVAHLCGGDTGTVHVAVRNDGGGAGGGEPFALLQRGMVMLAGMPDPPPQRTHVMVDFRWPTDVGPHAASAEPSPAAASLAPPSLPAPPATQPRAAPPAAAAAAVAVAPPLSALRVGSHGTLFVGWARRDVEVVAVAMGDGGRDTQPAPQPARATLRFLHPDQCYTEPGEAVVFLHGNAWCVPGSVAAADAGRDV